VTCWSRIVLPGVHAGLQETRYPGPVLLSAGLDCPPLTRWMTASDPPLEQRYTGSNRDGNPGTGPCDGSRKPVREAGEIPVISRIPRNKTKPGPIFLPKPKLEDLLRFPSNHTVAIVLAYDHDLSHLFYSCEEIWTSVAEQCWYLMPGPSKYLSSCPGKYSSLKTMNVLVCQCPGLGIVMPFLPS